MNRKISLKVLIALMASAAAMVGPQGLALAEAGTIPEAFPLSVSFSLDTPMDVVPGEPIILHYRVANNLADQNLAVDMSNVTGNWYTVTLTDGAGRSAHSLGKRLSPPMQIHHRGRLLGQAGVVDGGATDYMVISRSFAPDVPGKYVLTVHVRLPYAPVPASADDFSDAWLRSTGAVFTQDFSFPFAVTQANPTRLRQIAAMLQQQITEERYGPHFNALVQALFSMPESAASASWQALVDNSDANASLYADEYATELMGVDSPGAADLLTEMLQNTSLTSENHIYVGRCLKRMYNTGDAALKAHVSQVCSEKGISLDALFDFPTVL